MKVKKRDNTVELFQFDKIEKGVRAAFEANGKTCPQELLDMISSDIKGDDDTILGVEDIQDIIERKIMSFDGNIAKKYIIYRYQHKLIRDNKTKLSKDFAKKLFANDVQNQNANMDEHSFGGRMGEASRIVMKQFALDNCMSRKSCRNHESNRVYIHDLDSYAVGMHNCLTIPIDYLLANGFTTRQTDVRPAKSINTAFQLFAVVFQLQSLQQFGGVSYSHCDWTMVPYVRMSFYKHYCDGMGYLGYRNDVLDDALEDISIDNAGFKARPDVYEYAMDMTERELKQAVEGMYHNLNTLQSRSGNQLPFTSLNYGTCTLLEGRMVIDALLEGSIKGVGKFHKTPIFPCGIFQLMKGVNREEGDPNYDLYKKALKSTSQRLYPNYVNVDWSVNAGYDPKDPTTYTATMGCRTYNGFDINGMGQKKDGRGNICPVTVILPTVAMEAKENAEKNGTDVIGEFFDHLTKVIGDAKDMLIERYNWICKQSPLSASFMWENNVMGGYDKEEGISSALKHGTLALGQLGLAEALQILIQTDHTTPNGLELAKRIESLFKSKCAAYKKKYKLNIGVYYTPAENLCYTAMKKFKNKYGVIENVSDREYFTNSMHVPVWREVTPFEKIDIESELTGYSNAGCITYVELPSTTKNNLEALETIVNYAMDKDVPYFAVNVPNDTCNDCGYCDEMNDVCPQCGGKNISHLRRVTGYLTGDYKTAFNEGKIAEVRDRVKHVKQY